MGVGEVVLVTAVLMNAVFLFVLVKASAGVTEIQAVVVNKLRF